MSSKKVYTSKVHVGGSGDKSSTSAEASQSTFPHRNIDRLYCPASTYLCAIGANNQQYHHQEEGQEISSRSPCIPCAYKVSNFDIALDHEFTKLVPNQRPEQCPRSNHDTTIASHGNTCVKDGMMGYKRGMNVLTVGDGDFSFSMAVAKLVVSGDSGMVVATSYEDLPTLQRVYPAFDDTLNALKNYSTRNIIGYKVDAMQLQKTLPRNVIQSNIKFQRICWNFPCTAIGKGQDGQNAAMEENKELVRNFMINALRFLDEKCGEIHMCHKTKPPYNQWKLETVAMEAINKNGNLLDFGYKGRLVFDKSNLPPYSPRKALDRKSFPHHDACVYVFGFSSAGSTIPNNEEAIDFEKLDVTTVIPVTTRLIESVRTIHLQLATYRRELKCNGKKRQPKNKSESNPSKGQKQRKRK
jgi:25S rRNA (uracil2634-N3)-methyltransferase